MEHEKGCKLTKYDDQSVKIMVWPFASRECAVIAFSSASGHLSLMGSLYRWGITRMHWCGHASLNVIKVMRSVTLKLTWQLRYNNDIESCYRHCSIWWLPCHQPEQSRFLSLNWLNSFELIRLDQQGGDLWTDWTATAAAVSVTYCLSRALCSWHEQVLAER